MFKTQNLYQNKNEWKNVKLGDSPETIGEWGGLLTSITMMLNGIGYNETPYTVNEKLKNRSGFLKALPAPSLLPYIWPNCRYMDMTRCEKSDAPITRIDKAVAAGKPVILQVDSREQTGIRTHFVLVKEKKGDDYVLYDPYWYRGDGSHREVLLTRRYNCKGAKPEAEISAVLWFDFHKAKLPEPPEIAKVPIPADPYTLFAAEECLVLRANPSADSYPLKALFMGTELICVEPKAIAKAKLGVYGQWIRVQDPAGDQGYVAAWFVSSTNFPALTPRESEAPRKKWCLKNVSVESPRFESRDGNGIILDFDYKRIKFVNVMLKDTVILRKGTVVNVIKPNVTITADGESASWSAITYQETYYDMKEKWVTTRLTGWVRDADLDDYREDEREEFRKPVVDILNATKISTDAAQYMTLAKKDEEKEDEKKNGEKGEEIFNPYKVKHNLCGQLCVASIVGKDIDTVLREWAENQQTKGLYNSTVGEADKPLKPSHIDSLLGLHVDPKGEKWKRYKDDYIPLAAQDEGSPPDPRRASEDLKNKLKEYYFITNLKINLDTGDLEAAFSVEERNHWVVLDRITRDGTRVELYNPFPNRREEYSFGEFYKSVHGNPNSGWWIKREVNPTFTRQQMTERRPGAPESKADRDERPGFTGEKIAAASRKADNSRLRTEETFQSPTFEVAIDNRTAYEGDAEQYLYIRGEGSKPKTKLCGEFSVAFILGQSVDTAFGHWQEGLKKEEPGVWELATLLQAYGFNRKKHIKPEKDPEKGKYYVAPNVEFDVSSDQYFKSFSIDTVLEYWKGVQPDLYNSILGSDRNEPTGPEDLITILKAYGYVKDKETGREDYSYYRPGSQEMFGYAPGRDAEVIGKTHYLLAGVNINGTTGNLQPSGVAHWVVVTKITPRGNLVGGNGGWVELYNPFPNCWQEYSYREFMAAFRGMSEGTTLWVKKEVSPVFSPQDLAAPKSKEKDLKSGKGKAKNIKANPGSDKKRKVDINKEKEAEKAKDKDKGKKGARFQEFDNEPPLDANEVVCKRLGVDAIPWEVGRWVHITAEGDRFFAEELAGALLECGIVSVSEEGPKDKKIRTAVLTDPSFSKSLDTAIKKSLGSPDSSEDPALRVARAVVPLFAARAIEGIKKVRESMPVHVYKPRAEFRAWTRGLRSLASQVSDPLDILIKERLDRLSVSVKDRPETFQVCRVILSRFTSGAVEEEIEKIWKDAALRKQITEAWELNHGEKLSSDTDPERVPKPVREWILTLADEPRKNIYRVKRWGSQDMDKLEFDIGVLHGRGQSSNFQAIGLYNEATGFGAISNYLVIPPKDVRKLEALQIEDEYQKKREDWLRQKMTWLCQHRGSQYMFADEDNYRGEWGWRRADGIRWGPIALGGNLVQVVETAWLEVKLPSRKAVENVKMAKLKGFRRTDWDRPLDQLLAEGLLHRCFCVYKGNDIGDSPQGIVYSPFWSPEDWEFKPKPEGKRAPTAFWIPFAYLENESIDKTILPLD